MSTRKQTFRIAIRAFEPFESALRRQWATFKAAEGLDLELEIGEFETHPIYVELFEKEGLKRGDWDVALVNTDWLAQIYQAQAALDLAPFIQAHPPDEYPQGWMPSLLRAQQFDQQIVGLPFHDGPQCLIYRKDLFDDPQEQTAYQEKYGSPLRLPEAWAEFAQIARFFHRPERRLYGTVFAFYPDRHNTVYDFCVQVWTRGGEIFNAAEQRVTLNTSQAAESLAFYRDIIPDALHPEARNLDSVKSGIAFAQGEVALMTNWFGFAAMGETHAESQVRGYTGIGSIPRGDNGATATLNVYWLLCIGAGSPHRNLAYRLLHHCASPAMDRLVTEAGAIGCRKSTWHDPEINRTIPFYYQLETLHADARELPRLANWADIGAVMDDLVTAAITSDEPVDNLLAKAQAKIDQL
jgi:multiple sugar transport system substrate-binding protein